MINWKYYPANAKIPNYLLEVVNVFEEHESRISSDIHSLKSNDVLAEITPSLKSLAFKVESGNKKTDKIKVPVTYKEQGEIDLSFNADAYQAENKIVLEVEAGRALANYQFLKDLFQACMMENLEYFCVAMRKTYETKSSKSKDYEKILKFFDALYVSNRIKLPLKGILVIGY